jgi:hypothetical protein
MATCNYFILALYLQIPSVYDFGSLHTNPSYGFKGITREYIFPDVEEED